MNHREIANRLLAAYEESGLSYSELSRLTGIPKSMIQRYLAGNVERIPIERMDSLCKVFHLDINELLGWSEPDRDGRIMRSVTPEQNYLLDASHDLTDDERRLLLNMIEAVKATRRE